MKNNKGFTLVELLAAIAIIGILSTIAIVSVNRILNKSRESYYDTLKKTVTEAGKSYFLDNRIFLPKTIGKDRKIYVKQLIDDNKYLDEVLDYNKNKCDYNKSYVVAKRNSKEQYSYSISLCCPNDKKAKSANDTCK